MLPRSRFSYLLIFLFVFQSCCRPEPDRYYDIAEVDLAFVPYDSSSTFRLQDSLGRAVNFFSVETHSLRYEYVDDCAECCDDNYGQVYSLQFRGDNPAVSIHVILSQLGFGGNPYKPTLEFWLHPESKFQIVLDGSDCPIYGGFGCHDSLRINGHLYEHVMEMVPSYNHYNDSTSVGRLWYTKSHSILKYKTLDGQTWEVMP